MLEGVIKDMQANMQDKEDRLSEVESDSNLDESDEEIYWFN